MTKSTRAICGILLIICGVLWLKAAFIEFGGFYEDSAYDVVKNAVYYSEFTDGEAWPVVFAALGSGVGTLICLITVLIGSVKGTRIAAILSDASLAIAMISVISELSGDSTFREILKLFGFGFWGIFVLMIVVGVDCGGITIDEARIARERQKADEAMRRLK